MPIDNNDLLAPLEAALLLRITPELLFAYTKYAPKKVLAPLRKLSTVHVEGRTMFHRAELEAFDSFLSEPWADPADPRPEIPSYIVDYLKVECGGQCARCGAGFPLKNAHVNAYRTSQSHHHHNLIRLCGGCHDAFDAGVVPLHDIAQTKQGLIAKTRTRIEATLNFVIPRMRTLPPPTTKLIGREEELSELVEALRTNRVVAIQGPGGCGKTELTIHGLTKCADPRRVLWVEVETSIGGRALEIALRSSLSTSLNGQLVPIAAELDKFGGYVVFDGVEQAANKVGDSFEAVIGELIAGTEQVRFVFTSQVGFLDIPIGATLALTGLSSIPSRELLCANSTVSTSSDEQAALATLEEFADGHPLTLKIANALLRFYGSAAVVASRINAHGAKAISHPIRNSPGRGTSLERCLLTAYNTLDRDAQLLMYVASNCPAGFIEEMPREENFGIKDPRSVMASLRHWHLLETVWQSGDTRRLRALSPIRAFMREMFAGEHPDVAATAFLALTQEFAIHSVVMDHMYFSGGDVALGMERFDTELGNLLHVLAQGLQLSEAEPAYLDHVRRIASSLQVFYFIAGLSDGAIEIMRVGIDAALKTSEFSEAAGMATHLLIHAERLGNECVKAEAITALRALAERSPEPSVKAQHAVAEAQLAQSDHRLVEALQWADAAVELLLSEASKNPGDPEEWAKSLSMALMMKGRALEDLDKSALALTEYEKAVVLMRQVKDTVNPGAVFHQMGNCLARLKDYEKSLERYLDAVALFANMGVAEHIGNSLSEIGYLLLEYESGVAQASAAVSIDTLIQGAEDVVVGAKVAYLSDAADLQIVRCRVALRRVLGLCMLASLTGREHVVVHVCGTIRQEILAPHRQRLMQKGLQGLPRSDDEVAVMLLDMSMSAAGNLAALGADAPHRPSISIVGVAASQCFPGNSWASRSFPLFAWLAAYLRVRHGVLNLQADALESARNLAEKSGGDFELPGFPQFFEI